MNGPPLRLPCCSFAWGPAAAALQQLPAGAGDAAAQQRRQLLQQRLPLDPARAALTACLWPEACTLAEPGSSSQGDGGGGDGDVQLMQLPGAAAAYDPGFLLPFCACALRQQLLSPRAFAEAGLLSGGGGGVWARRAGRQSLETATCASASTCRGEGVDARRASNSPPTPHSSLPPPTPFPPVCLRGLASADAGCRAAAYQSLALLEAQLGAAKAADFRERQQLG